jgi:hypothetical protein
MHADLGRAHAAGQNIIPTSTGAAIALPRVVKGLIPKPLEDISLRGLPRDARCADMNASEGDREDTLPKDGASAQQDAREVGPQIFVSQQEAPHQSENESLAVRVFSCRKEKVKWCYVWGIWRIRGKSDSSLRHKVEGNINSVAWRIIGVNDSFAFACWNRPLTNRSEGIINIILRTVLLPFGHRVDETKANCLSEDRFLVVNVSSCPGSRLIILGEPLPLPNDLSIKT